MHAQVRNSFHLSLHCLRRCYTVFFIVNIFSSGAAHIFQDLHCCTIHRCYTARLYKSCSDCSATQLSSDPVSFAPVLHSLLQGLHLCSGARKPSPGPALFAPVLHSFLRGLHCTSMHTQVQDIYLHNLHCLLLCYTAFLGPASFDQLLHRFLQG